MIAKKIRITKNCALCILHNVYFENDKAGVSVALVSMKHYCWLTHG